MTPSMETEYLHSAQVELSTFEVSKELDMFEGIGWWTNDKLFDIERQALFGKFWLPAAHTALFTSPGSYVALSPGPFNIPVYIIRGKDGIIRAFHNVCRHRAYMVARKPKGNSLVLGCKYHGWSYDTLGKLVKAPQFDAIPGFNEMKGTLGLWNIPTCIDRAGFVWINVDDGIVSEDRDPGLKIPDWKPFGHDEPIRALETTADEMQNVRWLEGWEQTGTFNWKIVAAMPDNELCLRVSLPTAADSNRATKFGRFNEKIGSLFNSNRLISNLVTYYIQGERISFRSALQDGLNPITTNIMPSTSITRIYPFVILTRLAGTNYIVTTIFTPLSTTKTSVRCDVYCAVPNNVTLDKYQSLELDPIKMAFRAQIRDLEIAYAYTIRKNSPATPNREDSNRGNDTLPTSGLYAPTDFQPDQKILKTLKAHLQKRAVVAVGEKIRRGGGRGREGIGVGTEKDHMEIGMECGNLAEKVCMEVEMGNLAW